MRFSGRDLGLKGAFLPSTASHKIWAKEFELYPDFFSESTVLIIKTRDDRLLKINIHSGKVELGGTNKWLVYIILAEIFVFSIIILIMLFKRKSRFRN